MNTQIERFMAVVAMEPSPSSSEASQWSASTNWIVAEGSLGGAISYDTSAEDSAGVDPAGVLLLQPPELDSIPCEITVSFVRKHDIHRIYIRSTARIYEIYHTSHPKNSSKEYLCTVRCGAASPPSDEATTKSQDSDGTMKAPKQIVHVDSSSDEDGWLEVKLPDSPSRDDQANILSKKVVEDTTQVRYEATAEISDASPCLSLTFRLLSLHTKASAHIREIYIYADPIESANLDTPVGVQGNMGGASLLAMFVPGLMQFSKFGISRTDERCSADVSVMQKCQIDAGLSVEMSSLNTGSMEPQEAISSMEDTKPQQAQEPEVPLQHEYLGSSQKVTNSDELSDSVVDEIHPAFSRVEKVLNELVSRVGRIEAFCSKFEENMMKPLGGIEMRLQRLEQQLDVFAVRSDSAERCPCTRISTHDFSFNKLDSENEGRNTTYIERTRSGISTPASSFSKRDSENKDCNTTHRERDETVRGIAPFTGEMAVSVRESQAYPGLMFKAPDFSDEDTECTCGGDTSDSVVLHCHHDSISTAVHSNFAFVPESENRPGLAVVAPEFINEDEECTDSDNTSDSVYTDSDNTSDSVYTDSDNTSDSVYTDSDNTSDSVLNECPGGNNLSLDGALASALEALMTSTSTKSPNTCLMDMPDDSIVMESELASSSARDESTGAEYLFSKSDMGSNGSVMTNAVGKGTDFIESLSLADEAPSHENLVNEFHVDGRVCEASDDTSGKALQIFSDLNVKVPEFITEDKAVTSYPHGRDCSEHQAASLDACRPASMLALFLASKMSKPLECSGAQLYSPSEVSLANNNELAPLVYGVLTEGAANPDGHNHRDHTTDMVDLDLYLNSGPRKCVLKKNGSNTIGQNCSNVDALIGKSTIDDSLEQRDRDMRWHEWSSNMMLPEERLSTQSCHDQGGGLKISIDYANDSDSEEFTFGSPSFNPLGRGCNVNNSASLEEDLIIKMQIPSSGGISTVSYLSPFILNESNRQATDERISFSYVESTPNHCEIAKDTHQQPSVGCSYQISDAEIKLALQSASDDRVSLLDMNCSLELNEKNVAGILLRENSIGETSDESGSIDETSDENGGKSVVEEQHKFFSFEDIDQNSPAVDLPLFDMEDLTVPSLIWS